ncbi:ABC transporter G family member 20 [Electrophorus electricus]|uniref:ABC transporter G family member 20 n=1 Tax=Electrophorus electricus TaxID=8005 RepID=UPI0015CFC3B6|nr:ABC transporter G family member 20 [Electrophorus electricus]XP_035389045.1 ABC transporter G family member 20 [Electrophorus electricus]XP_035389046.1 ABC transporter G family member 20 [Electrophorus electricus]XP_035389047.1 ABC transporter G family member 20 [Electrophorus electricus]
MMKAAVDVCLCVESYNAAILCRDVCRSYGKLRVLTDLNLSVPQGQIYGLLGPSGCGKTTLLKCIVGTLKISRGHISVLGKPPAFPGHEVPGRMVGYMPQDIALYNEFTISETLWFYGRVHGLSSIETQARMDFLINFLDLPQKKSLVRNLSGGQRRRVSLGAALLQNPQLLILDEPTVGVDPVLRAKIWQHLVDIVRGGEVSVIITTHYIEEARQAHTVGLMRNGRLLYEGKPEAVMKQHNAATLESAFLQLCEDSDQTGPEASAQGPAQVNSPTPGGPEDESRAPILGKSPQAAGVNTPKADWKVKVRHVIPKWRNIVALTIKTLVRMKRNPGSLCFQFLLPMIQICLMCLCIGGEPRGIEVAVVNNESSSSSFSRTLLSLLDNASVHQVSLSHSQAMEGIRNGEYWGVLEFGQNFTSFLTKRMLQPRVSREVVEGGSVHVWLDLTNQQIAIMLQKKLHEAFQAFIENKMGSLAYLVSVPVKFEEPIYGSQNTDFTTFVTPGAVLSITFYLAVGLTALSFVLERKEGLMDRCRVAGVSSLETMLAHLFSQLLVISVQITLLLSFILLVFKIPNEGSLALVVTLIVLQGVTGISFGLVISSAIDDEQSANQAALGIFYPNLIISGVIWPVECIPYPLRYLSLVLPQTYASESLRCIMYRGWGLSRMMVWRGFAITLGWNTFFLILATVILKMRM